MDLRDENPRDYLVLYVPPLRDVHRSVPPPKLEGAGRRKRSLYSTAKSHIHVVKGSYQFFHYRSSGMEDRGWGCAYRSMQTIFSWYVSNGFCTYEGAAAEALQIVNHRAGLVDRMHPYYQFVEPSEDEKNDVNSNKDQGIEPEVIGIQMTPRAAGFPGAYLAQCLLMSIGEKPETFLGTNGWIGSQEVGRLLSCLIGPEVALGDRALCWKEGALKPSYLFSRTGAELHKQRRRLAKHFREDGTPVFLGGGQLAFTILGVAYAERSGEAGGVDLAGGDGDDGADADTDGDNDTDASSCYFLVLDPHYDNDGRDEIKQVISVERSMAGGMYRGRACEWRRCDHACFDRTASYSMLLLPRPKQV